MFDTFETYPRMLYQVRGVLFASLVMFAASLAGPSAHAEQGSGSAVVSIRFMGNKRQCLYDTKVVKQFSPNTFHIIGNKEAVLGAGILDPDCRRILTVAHIFDDNMPGEMLSLKNPNTGERLELDWSTLKRDPPLLKGEFGRDRGYVALKGAPKSCSRQRFDVLTEAQVDQERMAGTKFHLLKSTFAKAGITTFRPEAFKLCSEQCDVFSRGIGGFYVELKVRSFIHNCNTVGSNSGSPIIMERKDGTFSVIALHSQTLWRGEAVEDDTRMLFKFDEYVNSAQPITELFLNPQ